MGKKTSNLVTLLVICAMHLYRGTCPLLIFQTRNIDNDRKPNMIGMANWLGVHRDTVHQWKTGATRSNTHYDLIKKAIDILEELWVDYMQNGKINPASGIFLGKNMFGYKDQQDLVVTPNNPLGEEPDPDKLVEQYQKALPPED